MKKSCVRSETEIIALNINKERISYQVRCRLKFRGLRIRGSYPHVIAFAIVERIERRSGLPRPSKEKPDLIETHDVSGHLTLRRSHKRSAGSILGQGIAEQDCLCTIIDHDGLK